MLGAVETPKGTPASSLMSSNELGGIKDVHIDIKFGRNDKKTYILEESVVAGDEDVLESLNLDEESRNLRKKLPKGEHKEIVQNLQRSKINVRLRKEFLR